VSSTIGIKLANGEFYPVLENNSDAKKRLVLTTVHDNQQSVRIDLQRSDDPAMSDALSIGSIMVEDIKDQPRGEPSIEMLISSTANGDISAEAVDLKDDGGRHHLNVSIKSLDDDDIEPPPSGLYERAMAVEETDSRKKTGLAIPIIVLLLLLTGAALWFFISRGKSTVQEAAPPPVITAAPAEEPAPPPPPVVSEPPPPPQPVVVETPPPPVVVSEPPAAPVQDGVPYKVRWGDTLWDISGDFYGDPHLYSRIARFNNIRNPNRIISGTTVQIPPRAEE